MSRGRNIGQKLRARRRKHGYVHRLPLSERYVDDVAIGPGYQFLLAGTPTVTFTITRTGEAVLPASVRWRSGELSGLVEWEQAEAGPKTIVLDTYDASVNGSVFEVELYDPQYLAITEGTARVELEQLVLTSRPYPINVVEGLGSSPEPMDGRTLGLLIEALGSAGEPEDGELRSILRGFALRPEAMEGAGEPMDGTLRQILRGYDDYAPEAMEGAGEPMDGELRAILIRYENYPPEALTSAGEPLDGTLEVPA